MNFLQETVRIGSGRAVIGSARAHYDSCFRALEAKSLIIIIVVDIVVFDDDDAHDDIVADYVGDVVTVVTGIVPGR